MPGLAKLQDRGRNRVMRIWEAILAYVNVNDGAVDPSTEAWENLETLISDCMELIGGDFDSIQGCHDLKSQLASRGVKLLASDQPEIRPALEYLANRYRPEIRRVIAWLSAPDRHSDLAVHAAEFLRMHGTEIKMHIGSSGYDPDDGLLISEYWPNELGSVVSPVCKFILDQIERHDIGREPLRDVIPIGSCDRPECDKFRVIKKDRKGSHIFCSNQCKARFHQGNKTKEEKAAKMREYRETIKNPKRKVMRRGKERKHGLEKTR